MKFSLVLRLCDLCNEKETVESEKSNANSQQVADAGVLFYFKLKSFHRISSDFIRLNKKTDKRALDT